MQRIEERARREVLAVLAGDGNGDEDGDANAAGRLPAQHARRLERRDGVARGTGGTRAGSEAVAGPSCPSGPSTLPPVDGRCLAVPAGAGRAGRALAATLATVWPAAPMAAQELDLLMSLTSDGAVMGQPVADQELLFHAPGGLAHVAWASQTLGLLAGQDSTGLHLEFGDIDAVHDAGGGSTAATGLYISLVSDEHGFEDGDVIEVKTGGFEVFLPESFFVDGVGAVDGNLDVDAFALCADGSLLFSLAEDEDSLFLDGDDPGVVRDGAVLHWPVGAPQALILHAESELDAFVSQALGAQVSIGDTKGLAEDPSTGSLLFTVQSPSSDDASVFSTFMGGSLVPGHTEMDFGFDGAAEADAITVATRRFPGITVSDGKPSGNDVVTVTLRGAEPGKPHVVLAALSSTTPGYPLGGWGALVLANDALLGGTLATAPDLMIVPDGLGAGFLSVALPPVIPIDDIAVQVVAPAPDPLASNPLVLELEQ